MTLFITLDEFNEISFALLMFPGMEPGTAAVV